MIALDSWIWLEFFLEGKKAKAAEAVLKQAERNGGIISTLALTEIQYGVGKQQGLTKADELIYLIEHFPKLKIVPVVHEIAKLAADLRLKYYSQKRQLSYADTIHLATAILAGATRFISGDPDFRDMEEISTEII